jgi:uncharacterized protein YcsI (UPF0317 family)
VGSAPLTKADLKGLHPREIRALIRERKWTRGTEGLAEGYAQANLVVIPKEAAFEFLLFCQRNPKPCPVVEVTDPGSPIVQEVAPGADLRTDLPRYRVYEKGECVAEVEDIADYWREDLVGFLLGCSYTFETALLRANIPLRHHEENKIVSLYVTNIPCRPAGRFHGPMVVSMRPVRRDQVVRAIQVTARFPTNHGAPVHIGDPAAIGIRDLDEVAFNTGRVEVKGDEVPLFWGCGCTPQAVALEARLPFMMTHCPGYMFITDRLTEEMGGL